MFPHLLSNSIKVVALTTVDGVAAYQEAAGQDGAEVVSGEVDTRGYTGCLLLYKIGAGTNAAVVTFSVKQDTVSTMGTAQTLAGTGQTITDVGGNKLNRIIGCDIHRPTKRYLQVAYRRTTQNSAIDAIIAVLYRASHEAVTQETGLGGFAAAIEQFVSPAEGAA